MELSEIRSSFQVYIYSQKQSHVSVVADWLSTWSYNQLVIEEPIDLFEETKMNPPHIMIVHYSEEEAEVVEAIKKISPETQVIFLVDKLQFSSAILNKLAYDVLEWPLNSPIQLLRVLDHIAEKNYYLFRSEQNDVEGEDFNKKIIELMKKINEKESIIDGLQEEVSHWKEETQINTLVSASNQTHWQKYVESINKCQGVEEAIYEYMKSVSNYENQCEVYYFKYIASHKSLLLSKTIRQDMKKLNGLGVDLKQHKNLVEKLKSAMELNELKRFVNRVLELDEFIIDPIYVERTPVGVLVYESSHASKELQIYKDYLNGVVQKLYFSKRFYDYVKLDLVTTAINKDFLKNLKHEISRARRIDRAVSLLLIQVDQYNEFVESEGKEEADYLMKMIFRVFEENTRVNDIIGNISANEMGIILPHTDHKGASIHAERLRQIVESADFSKILSSNPSITVSIGVSEYPTFSSGGDELFETTDHALYVVKSQGNNQVCLADTKVFN